MIRLPEVRPTLVDRLVGYFDPVRGMQRLRARAGLSIFYSTDGGGYDAGRSDKKSLQRYNPRARSARGDIHPGLGTMRARSRDQEHNNPLASGAIATAVTSIVGSGLTVQPNIDQDLLGMTEEQADAWEQNAARIFSLWADTTECDIEGELVFGQQQELAFRSVLGSGDLLRIRRFLWDADRGAPRSGHLFATKLQFVEADRISNPYLRPDTTNTQAGVQIDDDGRTVGYWVQTTHPGDYLRGITSDTWNLVPARDKKSGHRVASLLFHKRRISQRRGVPYLAPAIEPLKQLERYTEAELMAAVVSAMFTVFVKHEAEADAGPLTGIEGAEDTPTPGTGDLFLGNGLVVDLDAGEDVSIANPARPNAAFDPFVLSVLRQVGVALEIPFEILVKHFQSSYSASRGALLEAWKFFRARRRWLVTSFCQPVYEDVISEAVARGLLTAPGFFENPLIRRAWLGTQWTGDAMPQIDPLKEATAARLKVESGFSTIDRESRELNGSDFLSNHRQRRKEQHMRQAEGLLGGLATQVVVGKTDESDDQSAEDGTEMRLLLRSGG